MQEEETFGGNLKTHLKIHSVVDGDGLIVENIFNRELEEIRFLGIDAPEIKRCKKMNQDEREAHLPGQLLIELGYESWEHLRNLAQVGELVSILTEGKNSTDPYGRTLAYVYLSDGCCLNEKMIVDGFAKPYDRFFCSRLPAYQILSSEARLAKRGLFSRVNNF